MRLEVPVYDLSLIRSMWEGRVKKYRRKQKKEEARVEQSALTKINQQWMYRIHCKSLRGGEVSSLQRYLERSTQEDIQPVTHTDSEEDQSRLVLRLEGDQWKEFPRDLQWMTYLTEWHVRSTRILRFPEFLALFTELTVLDVPKNAITELPAEIGKLSRLRELNVNYNRLSRVPAELGKCENLERLELTGNRNLTELPFEMSSLKKLVHLDIAENRFVSIPICALRMTSIQLLDMSNNGLTDLPEDMDRLEHLVSLFIHKNRLSYLPHCLTNISSLKMIVVSGDELNTIPTRLCSNPDIKFIRLYDNPVSEERKRREEEEKQKARKEQQEEARKDSHDKEFIEMYIDSLKDRDTVPYSTTKVSISCLL
ncbi:leucine-rich repeat-containing protein 2 [Polymixia lowei]